MEEVEFSIMQCYVEVDIQIRKILITLRIQNQDTLTSIGVKGSKIYTSDFLRRMLSRKVHTNHKTAFSPCIDPHTHAFTLCSVIKY